MTTTFDALVRASTRVIPAENGCLNSTYSVNKNSYPQINFRVDGVNKNMTAHRAAWIFVNGDPGELVVDHLCFNKLCVNIHHLRLLTNVENSLWENKPKKCDHGADVRYSEGRQTRCRECKRAAGRRWAAKQRAVRAAGGMALAA